MYIYMYIYIYIYMYIYICVCVFHFCISGLCACFSIIYMYFNVFFISPLKWTASLRLEGQGGMASIGCDWVGHRTYRETENSTVIEIDDGFNIQEKTISFKNLTFTSGLVHIFSLNIKVVIDGCVFEDTGLVVNDKMPFIESPEPPFMRYVYALNRFKNDFRFINSCNITITNSTWTFSKLPVEVSLFGDAYQHYLDIYISATNLFPTLQSTLFNDRRIEIEGTYVLNMDARDIHFKGRPHGENKIGGLSLLSFPGPRKNRSVRLSNSTFENLKPESVMFAMKAETEYDGLAAPLLIRMEGDEFIIDNCTFKDNMRAIYSSGALITKVIISNCTFTRNLGYLNGGAIKIENQNTKLKYNYILLVNCKFINNTAGEIKLFKVVEDQNTDLMEIKSYSVVDDSLVYHNATSDVKYKVRVRSAGGAIYISRVKTRIMIYRCLFLSNSATSRGGSISVFDATLYILESRLENKKGTRGVNGDIFYGNTGSMYISNTSFMARTFRENLNIFQHTATQFYQIYIENIEVGCPKGYKLKNSTAAPKKNAPIRRQGHYQQFRVLEYTCAKCINQYSVQESIMKMKSRLFNFYTEWFQNRPVKEIGLMPCLSLARVYPCNEHSNSNTGQSYPSNNLPYPGLGQSSPNNNQPYPGLGQSNSTNNQPYPGLGQSSPNNNQPYPGLGQTFPTNNQPYPGLGQSSPNKNQPYPGLGQSFPTNNQPYPGLGQSSPNNNQPYPGLGQSSPNNNQPYPGLGNPPLQTCGNIDQNQNQPCNHNFNWTKISRPSYLTVEEPNNKCYICPYGATCKHDLEAKPNFWGIQVHDEVEFHRCPPSYCCKKSPCGGYNVCHGNRAGILCGKCATNYSQALFSATCITSDKCGNYWFLLFVVGVVLLYATFLMFQGDFVAMLFTKPLELSAITQCLGRNGNPNEKEGTNKKRPNAKGQGGGFLVLLFSYFQDATLLQINTVYVSKTTSNISKLKSVIGGLFKFRLDLFQATLKDMCLFPDMELVATLLFKVAFVPLLLGTLFVMYLVGKLVQKLWKNSSMAARAVKALMLALMFSYQKLSGTTFSLIKCVNISGTSVLFLNGNIDCYQSWQIIIMIYAALSIVPFFAHLCFGPFLLRRHVISHWEFFASCLVPLPFLISWPFRAYRKLKTTNDRHGGNEKSSSESEAFGVSLQGPFRELTLPRSSFPVCWSGVLILRRLTLSILSTFVTNPLQRLLCMFCVTFSYLFLNLLVKPYKGSRSQKAATYECFALNVVCMINIVRAAFEVAEYVPRGPITTISTAISGVENVFMVWMPLIGIIIIGIVLVVRVSLFLAILVAKCYIKRKAKVIHVI